MLARIEIPVEAPVTVTPCYIGDRIREGGRAADLVVRVTLDIDATPWSGHRDGVPVDIGADEVTGDEVVPGPEHPSRGRSPAVARDDVRLADVVHAQSVGADAVEAAAVAHVDAGPRVAERLGPGDVGADEVAGHDVVVAACEMSTPSPGFAEMTFRSAASPTPSPSVPMRFPSLLEDNHPGGTGPIAIAQGLGPGDVGADKVACHDILAAPLEADAHAALPEMTFRSAEGSASWPSAPIRL